MNVHRRVKTALALLSALVLVGCGGGSPPRDNYYRLAELSAPASFSDGPINGVIDVPPFRAAGVVNERAVLFRSGANQLSQYSYHHWFEPPGALLQRATMRALRESNAFELVTSPEMRLDRDFELLGNLRRFEHVPATSSVFVEVEISVRRVRGNEPVILKTYVGEAAAPGRGVEGAVAGISNALDTIYAELLRDLESARADL